MSRLLVGFLGASLLIAVLTGCAPGRAQPPPGRTPSNSGPANSKPANPYPVGLTNYPVAVRRQLPELAGKGLDGAPLATSQLRGHVVVVNVWASWCEPCKAESPALVSVAHDRAAASVRFLGLDENDTPAAAKGFLRSIGSGYPHLSDDGSLLAKLSGWLPPAVPGTLVLDAEGRVAARIVGPATTAQLRSVLAGLPVTAGLMQGTPIAASGA